MRYRTEATSIEGFVQVLATNFLRHGYFFYQTGSVPAGKDPTEIDRRLVEKYRIGISSTERARRKQRGEANMLYLRHERFFVLLTTKGRHFFKDEQGDNLRDLREAPIVYGGYSISIARGDFLRKTDGDEKPQPDGRYRVRVQIARKQFAELLAYFENLATHRKAETLARAIYNLAFEPYAPVRKQLLWLLFVINRARKRAGYEPLPTTCIRYQRRIVKPFEQPALDKAA